MLSRRSVTQEHLRAICVQHCPFKVAASVTCKCYHHFSVLLPVQVNSLATIDNEWAVDYVGRVEHFYEDFLELLSALNAREGVPKVPEELPAHLNTQPDECNVKSKQNSTECNKMVHFTGQHEHCYASITKFYEADITLLGHTQ